MSNSDEFAKEYAKEIMKERGLKGAKTRRLIEKIIKTIGTDKRKINVALKRAQIGHADASSETE
ncbi:hypothetical protein [Candidatus Borrarchaeum sp.]|uniref:hypothetical protein n=1 Tax=Candidatus Borrarchaeum sp. TaxID=2846742 RepID=UPI00257F2054|nr:hypothetical protein [Candidatus Borrarchaeum sp.]